MTNYQKIKSQKGDYHIYFDGYMYRPDRNGFRCTDCNCARGRIESEKFRPTGTHSHQPNYNKIKSKLISNFFVEMATKYRLTRKQMKTIYDRYLLKNQQYGEFIASLNAIWLRTKRTSKKTLLMKRKRIQLTDQRCDKILRRLNYSLQSINNDELANKIRNGVITGPIDYQKLVNEQIEIFDDDEDDDEDEDDISEFDNNVDDNQIENDNDYDSISSDKMLRYSSNNSDITTDDSTTTTTTKIQPKKVIPIKPTYYVYNVDSMDYSIKTEPDYHENNNNNHHHINLNEADNHLHDNCSCNNNNNNNNNKTNSPSFITPVIHNSKTNVHYSKPSPYNNNHHHSYSNINSNYHYQNCCSNNNINYNNHHSNNHHSNDNNCNMLIDINELNRRRNQVVDTNLPPLQHDDDCPECKIIKMLENYQYGVNLFLNGGYKCYI